MAKTTMIFGAVLIALGLIGYFGTPTGESAEADKSTQKASDGAQDGEGDSKKVGKRSVTALIPSFVGIALLVCGGVATNEKLRMHAMHGAVLVGLLGFLAGAGRGAMSLVKLMKGSGGNARSLIFVLLMAVICGVFVWMCINSFIQARKRREAEAS